MSWIALLYAKFGAPYPIGSLIIVAVAGAALFGGGWLLIGEEYRRQAATQGRVASAEGELAALRTALDELRAQTVDRDAKNEQQTEQRRRHREALATFMARGLELRERCRSDSPGSNLEADAKAWFEEVQMYLKANLDASFLPRFNQTRPSPFQPVGVSDAREGLWHGLDQRAETLNAFIAELR
jgi:hypothetical protein